MTAKFSAPPRVSCRNTSPASGRASICRLPPPARHSNRAFGDCCGRFRTAPQPATASWLDGSVALTKRAPSARRTARIRFRSSSRAIVWSARLATLPDLAVASSVSVGCSNTRARCCDLAHFAWRCSARAPRTRNSHAASTLPSPSTFRERKSASRTIALSRAAGSCSARSSRGTAAGTRAPIRPRRSRSITTF